MHDELRELRARLLEVNDLSMAAALLRWDQATYMPPGGAPARGRQLSTLSRIAHDRFTAPEFERALEAAERRVDGFPADDVDAALVRLTRREFDRAVKVPSDFISEMNEHAATSYQVWTDARPKNDFAAVRPMVEKMLDLSRRLAGFFPGHDHPADPLIDEPDRGMTVASVRTLFGELRARLVPLVQAIAERPLADDSCVRHPAPRERQLAFGLEVIRRFGYDFDRGRQDMTPHPFMTKFSLGDVRITTRAREDEITDALFSTLHECGHALYEQGIDPSFEGTPLAEGASAGLHESQSRLWENLVGRSRPFWEYFYPRIQEAFPEALRGVSLDTFYRAINKVERSLVRTDADEVTYNLHVMLRFDLELQMLEGSLAVADLPKAWRERFEADFGIPVPDDRNGVMQDVHWYGVRIGGVFQGYTLGNILSAQLFEAAEQAHPTIRAEIAKGEFRTLHGWLRDKLYRHGSMFTPDELVQRVTGKAMSIDPYMRYLWGKYGPLYGIEEVAAPASGRVG